MQIQTKKILFIQKSRENKISIQIIDHKVITYYKYTNFLVVLIILGKVGFQYICI